MSDPRVIVALDYDSLDEMEDFVSQLNPKLCRLKVGKSLFTHYGPSAIAGLIDDEFDVFLDLKFHDIPQTVADACAAAADLGVWMVNVHASGGRNMLRAARQSIDSFSVEERPLLTAVSVLTSLDDEDLSEIGFKYSADKMVQRLAKLAEEEGLDGMVCSAREAAVLRKVVGKEFCLVTPGIRLADSAANDQKRIMTPEAAIQAGADYLVIGRSITQSPDPLETLIMINESIRVACS